MAALRSHSSYAGADLARLVASVLDHPPFAGRAPDAIHRWAKALEVPSDWRARATSGEDYDMRFGPDTHVLVSDEGTVKIYGDHDVESVASIARFASELDFEIATIAVGDAVRAVFQPRPIGVGHYDMGWAMAFKGAGHEKYLSSRRWLEAADWQVHRGANDTTVIAFTDRAKPAAEQAVDCARLHPRFREGFLAPNHHRRGLDGIYTPADRLLRVTVVEREVTADEMLEACWCRDDKVANVAFVFFERALAEKSKRELWLRGLEVRLVEVATEQRLA